MIFKWILFFYLISFVALENCEGIKPENATECFSKNTSDSYCCYAISPGYIPFVKQCVSIPMEKKHLISCIIIKSLVDFIAIQGAVQCQLNSSWRTIIQ